MDSEEKYLSSPAAQGRWVSTTTAGLTVLVFVIVVFCNYILKRKRSSIAALPRGPSPWPIIGNLHMLGELPHRALKDLAEIYGPIMFMRFGSVPAIVVSSSVIAKQILKTHDLVFASRPTTAAGKYLFYNCKDLAFGPYGDYWRQIRKICVLELLTAKRIESFQPVREDEVSAMIQTIWHESENGTKPVNLTKAFMSLTSNIICRMLIGRKCSTEAAVGTKGFAELLREAAALTGAFYIGDFIPRLWWLDLQGIRKRMNKVHREINVFFEEIIDEHIKMREQNGRAINDFVDVLLNILECGNMNTGNDIKTLIMDMFTGGTDTSATTLEWAMSEILSNPAVKKRLHEEIDSVVGKDGRVKPCDLPSLEYLECVVKETLRLHSPAPLLAPRESMEARSVAGYSIPAKTRLIVNAWAIGRDPAEWGDDALAFKPERFIQGGRNGDINVKGPHFQLIPFGSGRRGCPAAPLAFEVVSHALGQLFHCFDWNLECKDGVQKELNMSEAFGITMPPRFEVFAIPSVRLQGPL